MNYYILGICVFCAIIIHELGHLIASKRAKCKVDVFSIGFGKPIFRLKYKGTYYQLCWILLGGYCSLEGEMEYSKKPTALMNLGYLRKLYIILAGIGANCLSAIFAFGLFVMFNIDAFYLFGMISILLGLSNLIPVPALDGSYPFLFLTEKVFGKKDGVKIRKRAIEIGMLIINTLNIICIVYLIYYFRMNILAFLVKLW